MFIHPVTQQLLTEFLGCGTKLVKNADKTPCISGREMTGKNQWSELSSISERDWG